MRPSLKVCRYAVRHLRSARATHSRTLACFQQRMRFSSDGVDEQKLEAERLLAEAIDEVYAESATEMGGGIKMTASPSFIKDEDTAEESKAIRDIYDTYRISEAQKEALRKRDAASGKIAEELLVLNPNVTSPLPFDLASAYENFQILMLLRHCVLLRIFDKIPVGDALSISAGDATVPSHSSRISLSELSIATQCDASVLYRVFRALSYVNYCTLHYEHNAFREKHMEDESVPNELVSDLSRVMVSHTSQSLSYTSDSPHYFTLLSLTDQFADANSPYADLRHSLQTGNCSKFRVAAEDYRRQVEAQCAISTTKSCTELARYFDFSNTQAVMEISNAKGRQLHSILLNYAEVYGYMYGTKESVTIAREHWKQIGEDLEVGNSVMHDVMSRLEFVSGDALCQHLADGNLEETDQIGAYILKWRLHEVNDSDGVRLLRNLRTAMQHAMDGGIEPTLLIVEQLLPESADHIGSNQNLNLADIEMLARFGGRERSLSELDHLAQSAGFSRNKSRKLHQVGEWHLLPYTPV